MNKPIVLLIIDGWGLSPSWGGNALSMNNPRNIESYWRLYPHAVLQALSTVADGEIVGDSRLGHTLIGTGRKVKSNFSRISQQIANKNFFKNQELIGAINWAKKNNSNLHLIGLVSEGGVHSHLSHLLALLDLAKKEKFERVFIDVISDGIDSGSTDILSFIEKIELKFLKVGLGKFSSIAGRFWAMDRSNNWSRSIDYFKTLTEKTDRIYPSIKKAVTSNYRLGNNDEFINSGLIADSEGNTHQIQKNDAVIMFNYREDRSRQLARLFCDDNFSFRLWRPKQIEDLYFSTFVNYESSLPAKVAFPSESLKNSLIEVLSKSNQKILKIAESQKYAHVTYFFNGGAEDPFPGEERKIIPSANLQSFENFPQMSAPQISIATQKAIKSGKYDLIVVNFANIDVIAHTGKIAATGQAVQIIDKIIKEIVDLNLKQNGITIITADHGNAEQMLQLKSSITERETLHTLNPVPFILISHDIKKNLMEGALSQNSNSLAKIIQASDTLADIAPTILELMKLPKPEEMTGRSLLGRLE